MEEDRTEINDLSMKNPEKVREPGELWEKEAKQTCIYPKPEGKKEKR